MSLLRNLIAANKIKLGPGSNPANFIIDLGEANLYSQVIADSLLNPVNPELIMGALALMTKVEFTDAAYGGNWIGLRNVPTIGEGNTQDWNGSARHPDLCAYDARPWIQDGATGIINAITAYYSNLQHLAPGATVNNMYYFKIEEGNSVGPHLNSVAFATDLLNNASVGNVHFLVGNNLVIPAGNWFAFFDGAYKNYFGTGASLFGSSVDDGSGNIIQATGGIKTTTGITTPKIASSGNAPAIAAGAGAGTGPTVGISGNDVSGMITVTFGTSPPTSGLNSIADITFNVPYGTAPRVTFTVVMTAGDTGQVLIGAYNTSTNGFSIGSIGSLAAQAGLTRRWNYHVIESI
jgi:hypothetical protein